MQVLEFVLWHYNTHNLFFLKKSCIIGLETFKKNDNDSERKLHKRA